MITTIQVNSELKEKLDALKMHHRETYNELILRLIKTPPVEKESLVATIEVLSDPETMRDIADGLEAYKRGEGTDFEQIKKKLRLNV